MKSKLLLALPVGMLLTLLTLAALHCQFSLRGRTLDFSLQDAGVSVNYISPSPKVEGGVVEFYLGLRGIWLRPTSV